MIYYISDTYLFLTKWTLPYVPAPNSESVCFYVHIINNEINTESNFIWIIKI